MPETAMPIEIRALTPADEADWRVLWRAYLEFYGLKVSEEVYASTFSRLLSGDVGEFSGRIALVDGKPVGVVHYLFHRHCWRIEDVCYLQDLYAAPGVRGTGVGRALIEAVYREADASGAPRVYWLTQDDNHTARKLYDRIGRKSAFIKYDRVVAA